MCLWQDLQKLHAWKTMGMRGMDPAKARSFFTVLHDNIIYTWMQDERLHAGFLCNLHPCFLWCLDVTGKCVSAGDLLQMVKEEYLVC